MPFGLNSTWPKPLAAEAVIDPVMPDVVSSMIVSRPLGVSCMVTVSSSPWFIDRSVTGLACRCRAVALSGLGGEFGCGVPLSVMNAKFTVLDADHVRAGVVQDLAGDRVLEQADDRQRGAPLGRDRS